jgi:hypothetical protein
MYCEGMSFGAIARVKAIKKNTIFNGLKKGSKPMKLEKSG